MYAAYKIVGIRIQRLVISVVGVCGDKDSSPRKTDDNRCMVKISCSSPKLYYVADFEFGKRNLFGIRAGALVVN